MVNNSFKENFYEKRKKTINVLIAFFISHKSDVKTFLKWILNQCYMALVNMTLSNNIKTKYYYIMVAHNRRILSIVIVIRVQPRSWRLRIC